MNGPPGKCIATCYGLLLLALSGCASWQAPEKTGFSALRERAEVASIRDVEVRGTVLSAAENKQFFAANLGEEGIQTVWLEVSNHSAHTLWLLTSGTDPDYFSPLEVAWPYHRKFASEANAQMDKYFDDMQFMSPVPPGVTRAGFLFTNPHFGTRVLNIDLLGQQTLYPFTLFPPIPGEQDKERIDGMYRHIAIAKNNSIEDEQALREMLEKLPCCARSSIDDSTADPINIIMVGDLPDIAAALVRRGYRLHPTPEDKTQLYNGRPPDMSVRKSGQGGVTSNWLRIWVAPFSYQGNAIVLAQSGRPVGGRFIEPSGNAVKLHPAIDETRELVIQDMMYSGGLKQLGFVAGVPPVTDTYLHAHPGERRYHSDGLRAVMFVITRPLSIEDIQILDWVPALQRREDAATEQLSREIEDAAAIE